MAEHYKAENERLAKENEALKKEQQELQKKMMGEPSKTWNIFKSLKKSDRKKVIDKQKVKDLPEDVKKLIAAAKDGKSDEVEELLEKGVPVDATGEFRETALHAAARWGHTHTVSVLIVNRADLDAKDEKGETPLHKAAEWGRSETVSQLIARGARLDVQNRRDKMTPLMIAAKVGQADVCKILTKEGASIKLLNSNGQSAVKVAQLHDRQECIDAIEKAAEKRRKSMRIDPTNL